MISGAAVIQRSDISELRSAVLNGDVLTVVDSKVYRSFPLNHILQLCVEEAFYCLPTTELIEFIGDRVAGVHAIEIGAGNGALGRALGIQMTDSFLQDDPGIRAIYNAQGQATIKYGSDVEKIDALDAVRKYSPNTVVGAWVTHKYSESRHELGGNMYGVDENVLLEEVSRYIMVGNLKTHHTKPILRNRKPEIIQADWVVGRTLHQEENAIMIWS